MKNRHALSFSFLLLLAAAACGDDSQATGGAGGEGPAVGGGGSNEGGAPLEGGSSDGGSGGMVTSDFTAGGERPVDVKVPSGYDPEVPTPLVILLHGYSATGALQDAYFGMSAAADAKGVVFAAPDGLVDPAGNQYWDATDACCNFVGAEVDDSGYLMGLVDEIATKVNVDPARIYFVGHSNGGFMSYRMACDHADRIAAIVSLAGAMHDDVADCEAAEPVSVLQIHGTIDETILYGGGDNAGNVYPGAAQSVADWAALNGCDAASTPAGTHDIEATLAGDETIAGEHVGCDAETTAQLWTIEGGGHIPNVADDFSAQVIDWLLLHAK